MLTNRRVEKVSTDRRAAERRYGTLFAKCERDARWSRAPLLVTGFHTSSPRRPPQQVAGSSRGDNASSTVSRMPDISRHVDISPPRRRALFCLRSLSIILPRDSATADVREGHCAIEWRPKCASGSSLFIIVRMRIHAIISAVLLNLDSFCS
jgi:hypothetical protein